jgi:hypothetical protein
MSKYRGVARDEYGNSLNGATVTVYDFGTTTLSSIYSDTELATAETNPVTASADGTYEFYAYPGFYDVQVAKSGFTTVTLDNEIIGGVMASCTGVQLGSFSPGASPDEIGNTNLGAAHLAVQYESNAFTVSILEGTYTYTGEETIIAEVSGNFAAVAAVPQVVGFFAYLNFDTTATLIGSAFINATAASQITASLVGLVELGTGDEISFAANAAAGGVVTAHASNYIVKRVG